MGTAPVASPTRLPAPFVIGAAARSATETAPAFLDCGDRGLVRGVEPGSPRDHRAQVVRRTLTPISSLAQFAVARSGLPSAFRSTATIERGPWPAARLSGGPKMPWPWL